MAEPRFVLADLTMDDVITLVWVAVEHRPNMELSKKLQRRILALDKAAWRTFNEYRRRRFTCGRWQST
jgi:hypothetical protein